MKRLVIIIAIVVLALLVLIFVFNPQLLADIWLYIVGLIGTILAAFKKFFEWLKGLFDGNEEQQPTPTAPVTPASGPDNTSKLKIQELESEVLHLEQLLKEQQKTDAFNGTTLTVLRYFHDPTTTLGLFFYNNAFFCYTLEDTYRAVKKKGVTRIPAGEYPVDFSPAGPDTSSITAKYLNDKRFKDFFYRHIHIKNVENFKGIYIHVGNNHGDTKGCLLIADGLNTGSAENVVFSSANAYTRFYLQIKQTLEAKIPVRIRIFDENWLQHNYLKHA